MLFEDSNPFVRQALSSRLTKNNPYDVFNLIKAVDSRLFYIRSGTGSMLIGDTRHALRPGTVILFGPGIGYIWEVEDVGYYVINFDYTRAHAHITQTFHPIHAEQFDESLIVEPVPFDHPLSPGSPIVIQDYPELERDIRRIVTEYQIGSRFSQAQTSALLKSTIVSILRHADDAQHAHDEKSTVIVGQVIEYIGSNYASELSNDSIAAAFHFHPTYLNRIFKACTGSTLHEYVLHYRLNMAMEILRTQNISVSETGKLCGFTNPYHFSKAFRRYTGKTPSAYQSISD